MTANFGPLSRKILSRLRESAVPVRTSVLVMQCAAQERSARSRVWRALVSMQSAGLVARRTVPTECPAHRGARKESFWMAKGA